MTNQPALIDNKITIFKLNPMTLEVEMPAGFVIDTPVAEVYINDVKEDDIVLPVTVEGQVFSFTFTTTHLALFKTAYLYIKFADTDYLLGAPLEVSMKATLPTQRVVITNLPNIGNVRVSAYTDNTVAAAAKTYMEAAQDAMEAAQDIADELAGDLVIMGDRVPDFLDKIDEIINAGYERSTVSVAGPVTGSNQSGSAVVTPAAKTIAIGTGVSGANSYLEQTFDLSVVDNPRAGDGLNVVVKLSETVNGSINSNTVDFKLYADGVDTGAISSAPASYDVPTKTFKISLPWNIVNPLSSLKGRLLIKSSAPNQAASTVITWTAIGVNLEKYLYRDAIPRIDEAVRFYNTISATFANMPVYTKIDMSGLTDVTAQLQAELNLAMSTSGVWVGRAGTPMITDRLFINQKIRLECEGMDLNAAIPTVGREIFNISTSGRVVIRNLITRRLPANSAHQPTFCRFESTFTNVNSLFENIELYNMPSTMAIEYCDRMTIRNCWFGGGQFYGLRIGYGAPASTSNVTVEGCTFNAYLDQGCGVRSLEGFTYRGNKMYSTSGSTFKGRALELVPNTGAMKMVRIENNQFYEFREWGISLVVGAGVSVSQVYITNNILKDLTPYATDNSSRAIHIAGNTKNISAVDISLNKIWCKEIGVRMDNVSGGKVLNNQFWLSDVSGGSYTTSQPVYISNSDYLTGQNSTHGTFAVANDVATGNTVLTTF